MSNRDRFIEAQKLGRQAVQYFYQHGVFPIDEAYAISWLICLPQHQYPSLNPSNAYQWVDYVYDQWRNHVLHVFFKALSHF